MAKDTSATPGPLLPWAGKIVRPEQVDEELTYLWYMSADNMRTSQNLHVRTSVLNLVLCASDAKVAQRASALLRDLASTHIARVTLLILDTPDDTSGSVSTWVTLRSFPIISDIMRHNFEQVTIRLSGSANASAASILQPLLKPDLPVYLWWLGDLPQDDTVFRNLIQQSTRVIIDSNRFRNPHASLRALSSLLQSLPESAVSDLNWGRLTRWRELIAQFFDVSEYKPYLSGVTAIEIEHTVSTTEQADDFTEQGVNPTCALFLAAWLKSRLGWQFVVDHAGKENDNTIGSYTWFMDRSITSTPTPPSEWPFHRNSGHLTSEHRFPAGTDGVLSLRPRLRDDLPAGTICLVRLFSMMDGKQATFIIDREDDPDHVYTLVELDQETRPQRTVHIQATTKIHELLHDELEIMGRDHLYEETLHEVFDLLA